LNAGARARSRPHRDRDLRRRLRVDLVELGDPGGVVVRVAGVVRRALRQGALAVDALEAVGDLDEAFAVELVVLDSERALQNVVTPRR
jgi:hypothetical protein